MFTEILKVKPVLDKGAAKQVELSLSQRFKRISDGLGKGLKLSLKGAAIAGGAALGSALMNPIKEVEEKVTALLARGRAAQLEAEDLGTTAGKLLQLRAVAQSKGMDPDKLNGMLESFQKQRDEVAYKQSQGEKLTAQEQALADLPKDTIDAFFSLQGTLKGLDDKTRARLTRDLLGDEATRGSTKRFLESDWNKESRKLNIPSQQRINRATDKLGAQADKDLKADARRDLNEYVNTGENKNLSFINDTMNKREDEQAARFQNQMDMYKELAQVRAGVDKAVQGIDALVEFLGKQIPIMVRGFEWMTSGKMIQDLSKEFSRLFKQFKFW